MSSAEFVFRAPRALHDLNERDFRAPRALHDLHERDLFVQTTNERLLKSQTKRDTDIQKSEVPQLSVNQIIELQRLSHWYKVQVVVESIVDDEVFCSQVVDGPRLFRLNNYSKLVRISKPINGEDPDDCEQDENNLEMDDELLLVLRQKVDKGRGKFVDDAFYYGSLVVTGIVDKEVICSPKILFGSPLRQSTRGTILEARIRCISQDQHTQEYLVQETTQSSDKYAAFTTCFLFLENCSVS
jgi:hypothetical protein